MSEEEKKAIKCLEVDMLDNKQIEIILNLIERQQKEIEELQQKLDNICKLREHFIEIYNDDEDEDNDI